MKQPTREEESDNMKTNKTKKKPNNGKQNIETATRARLYYEELLQRLADDDEDFDSNDMLEAKSHIEQLYFALLDKYPGAAPTAEDIEDALEEKREKLRNAAGAGKDAVISSLKMKIIALEAENMVKEAVLDKFITKLMAAAVVGQD